MSRSSFSKAYEEITNLEPMEMTFTIEDADLDKLHDVLKDINVKECPWFEVQDKHGVKAKYYREQRWIPCSERLPEPRIDVWCNSDMGQMVGFYDETTENWYKSDYSFELIVDAWQPLPSPYREEADEVDPEIIRCKDCVHYSSHKDDYMCGINVLAYIHENDFCSRAERRTR